MERGHAGAAHGRALGRSGCVQYGGHVLERMTMTTRGGATGCSPHWLFDFMFLLLLKYSQFTTLYVFPEIFLTPVHWAASI